MGRTPKPITIVALSPCDGWDEIKKLEDMGHKIHRVIEGSSLTTDKTLTEADIIIGGRCWRMTQHHRKYLSLAIKAARLLRYKTNEEQALVSNQDRVAAELSDDRDTPRSSDQND